MKILVIDVGGTHIKLRARGHKELAIHPTKIPAWHIAADGCRVDHDHYPSDPH